MKNISEEIRADERGIAQVLKDNYLVVPLNQREYSWEKEHVIELFSDLSTALSDGNHSYFLGTIVLTRTDDGVPEVSDGQQRLATTTLLFKAIRDKFISLDDRNRAEAIERDFLYSLELVTTEVRTKLKLNVDDHEYFTALLHTKPGNIEPRPIRDSHRKLYMAEKIAAEHIENILSQFRRDKSEPVTNELLKWVKFLETSAKVMVLRVPDQFNAFMMFETLNDRGLKTSQADLLKNFLLSLSGTRIQEAQQKWAKMIGILESIGRGDLTVTYLHHLLITKYGPTRERDVFNKLKSTITNSAQALKFLDELSSHADTYAALFNSDHRKWNTYGASIRRHITTINRDLQVEQIRSLMFAVALHLIEKEATAAIRLIVFWSVRILIVGTRGGVLDTKYSTVAEKISNGSVRTAAALRRELADVVPNDALFESSFSEARVSKSHLARYYLRALEIKASGQSEPEFVPTDDAMIVNLEHILPHNPDKSEWPGLHPDTAAAFTKRIGNFVILQASQNNTIGNAGFSKKLPVFKSSGFILTKNIGKYSTWGTTEIESRQKELAKLAVKTWPLK